MQVTRSAIECAAVFMDQRGGEGREGLRAVRLETDGAMVATDGHVLGIVRGGMESGGLESCSMSAEGVKAVLKAAPKNPLTRGGEVPPITIDASQSNQNGHILCAVPGGTIQAAKNPAPFPRYEQILPRTEPVYRLTIQADLLARLAEAAAALCRGDKMIAIDLEFDADGGKPMRATVQSKSGHTLTALVMPAKSTKPQGVLVPVDAK